MKLDAIAKLLQDEQLGRMGETIFIGLMPSECTRGYLLREPFGGTKIDHELPGFRQTSFMLVSRGLTHAQGRKLIDDAMEVLTFEQTRMIDDIEFRYCRPVHEPLFYPPTVGNEIEFLVNIDVCYLV